MRSHIDLFSSFSGKSARHLLFMAVVNPWAFIAAYRAVKALPSESLQVPWETKHPMTLYFASNTLSSHLASRAQASLFIANYEEWLRDRSRRGVRHALRQASKNGLIAVTISSTQAVEIYERIKSSRREPSDIEIWSWALPQNSDSVLAVAVYDSHGEAKALAVGGFFSSSSLLMTCMSTGEGDYARWLALASYLKETNGRGIQRTFSGAQLGLAKTHLEFQTLFGFAAVNVSTTKLHKTLSLEII